MCVRVWWWVIGCACTMQELVRERSVCDGGGGTTISTCILTFLPFLKNLNVGIAVTPCISAVSCNKDYSISRFILYSWYLWVLLNY